MRKVVEQENGCVVWGGSVALSPADDLLIRIEKALDLDSEGQMVASILSKKIAAGSTHILIDIPIGTTAKVRSITNAEVIKGFLKSVARKFNLTTKIIFTDGSQPVGNGIGPALEARDILSVLNGDKNAPKFLRDRALMLAGKVIEFSPSVRPGQGLVIATEILDSKKALSKFQAICNAQGGMREIPTAPYTHTVTSKYSGTVVNINNRFISRVAKLAGAPQSKAAGVDLFVSVPSIVAKSQPLFAIHSETEGELNYALDFLNQGHDIFQIEEN
jgi:thymidine phosphorylase